MKHFKTEEREDILIAYFDNSVQSNCLSLTAARELKTLFKAIHKKKLKGFILTSDYKIFCSGGNLSDYAKLKHSRQGLQINREITQILNELTELPVPTVCLVRGDCFGGGIEWISCFDKIFALPHSLFGMWQRKISLTWGWGGGHRLKMRVSKKDLQNILMSAENFSAYRALDMKMIDGIYEEDLILEKALSWLEAQKGLPHKPLPKIKSGNLKKEKKIFEELWMNDEHKTVLKNFLNKKLAK
jgi:enoyl-CoA hydratase/carnithine racemase